MPLIHSSEKRSATVGRPKPRDRAAHDPFSEVLAELRGVATWGSGLFARGGTTAGLALVILAVAVPTRSVAFELHRRVFSGGAVAASGGSYVLGATIGEAGPVSAFQSGGSFALGEGFWPGISDTSATSGVSPNIEEPLPVTNHLSQNSPNPFSESTWIAFAVATAGPVRLSVYDASGRNLAVLVDHSYPAGRYGAWWHGRDSVGRVLANGIYFYRLDIGAWSKTGKMLSKR